MYSSKAEAIIRAHDQSFPLFLYAAFQNIHTPLDAPDDYLTMYRQITRANGWTGLRKQAAGNIKLGLGKYTTLGIAFTNFLQLW